MIMIITLHVRYMLFHTRTPVGRFSRPAAARAVVRLAVVHEHLPSFRSAAQFGQQEGVFPRLLWAFLEGKRTTPRIKPPPVINCL